MSRLSTILMPLLLLAACVGGKARDHALIPPMQLAWPSVLRDVEEGVEQFGPDDDLRAAVQVAKLQMKQALEAKDRFKLAMVDWPLLKTFAEKGIEYRVQQGTIGPGVGLSLLERVRLFDEAYRKVIQ